MQKNHEKITSNNHHILNDSFFITKKTDKSIKIKTKTTKVNDFKNHHISNYSTYLSEIFKKENNIAIWKRKLNTDLIKASNHFILKNPNLEFSKVIKKNSLKKMCSEIEFDYKILIIIEDINKLVNEFCDLFNIKSVWLRLDAINKPMCPKFHTDDVRCRMVTTYRGPGTQWIPQNLIDKNIKESDIMELDIGHVALLKGEGWQGNEGNGLVHRSPHKNTEYKRLYMTIDFVEFYHKLNYNRLNKNI